MWGLCNYRLAGCTIFSLMFYRHWVQKATQGRGRVPAFHCPTPTGFGRTPSLPFCLLTQCIFIALLSIECLSIHLQWCTAPHARMEDASYITSEELKWSKALYQFLWNYITNYILQFLLPHLSHCPFPPETHSHIQTPDSRIVHAIHSQKIPGLP